MLNGSANFSITDAMLSLNLIDLTHDTMYYYRVRSTNTEGSTESDINNFRTREKRKYTCNIHVHVYKYTYISVRKINQRQGMHLYFTCACTCKFVHAHNSIYLCYLIFLHSFYVSNCVMYFDFYSIYKIYVAIINYYMLVFNFYSFFSSHCSSH